MKKQTLPFSSPELWEYLSKHSFLSRKHKLLYVSTPKVACTSLKWWFASLEGCSKKIYQYTDSLETDPDLIIHDAFSKIAPEVTGLPQEKLSEAILSNNYFSFAVVRNPYERIFSAWQSKLLLREPLQSEPYWEQDFFWLPVKDVRGMSLAFEAFLEHLAVYEYPYYWDVHWTPQFTLLRPDLLSYTKIAQIEKLKDLLSLMSKHLGTVFLNPFANYTKNKGLIPYSPDFITKRSAELIQLLYEEDFEKFGYSKSLPEPVDEPLKIDSIFQSVNLIRRRHKRISQIRSSFLSNISILSEAVQKKEQALQKFSIQTQNQESQIRILNKALQNKKESIIKLDVQIAEFEHIVQENIIKRQELSNQVHEEKEKAYTLAEQLSEREEEVQELSSQVREGKEWIYSLNEQLSEIKDSRGWKLLWAFWQIRLFFVPKDSWREHVLKIVWTGLAKTPEAFIKKVAKRVLGRRKFKMSKHAFAFDTYKRQRNRNYPTDLSSLQTPCKKGLVSIVLPVYNGADLLSEAIDTILSQTYENFELITVNDGSQDATAEILDEYTGRDARIKVIHQENQKLPQALNRGFAIARGEFLTWTSHDNCMKPDFLGKMVACLQRHPSWDMVYANMKIIGEDGGPLRGSAWFGGYQQPPGSENVYLPKDTNALNTHPNNFIGGAFLYRQRVPWLIGDYSPHRYTREDYDYWMRVNALLKLRHTDFKEPLYDYRFHSGSLTHRDEELGITRDRNKLMVFDDFRRDFFLTSLVWYVDEDVTDGQGKEVAKGLYSAVDRAGHILAEPHQLDPSLGLRLWVPFIYLKITDDPVFASPSQENLPPNTFKVLLNLSTDNLPDTLDAEWDLCLAIGLETDPPQLEPGRLGWITSVDISVLFSAIDIRARSKHLEWIETEINQPQPNKCKVSVIICTYQRGDKLLDTLRTVAQQTLPQKDYEIIVVNNDPRDFNVRDLVAKIRSENFAELPDHLRLLLCPILGLSHARNTGIAEARGEILLFLDDDSIAKEDVLESYWKAFSKYPAAGVIGGHIHVYPPHPLHIPWKEGFERYWSQFVTGCTDYSIVTNWWEYPWGANWSARREALFRIGGFRGSYGRRGRDFSGGEEIVAASLIERLGYSIAVLPQAEVTHQVEEERFTLKHLKHTIRAGLFVQYQAQKELHFPVETSVGNSFNRIVENIFKLIPALISSNPNKKADFHEAYYYNLARWQLLGRQIKDGFRQIRRPVTRNK
jgi:O-antigen biosynthesis protein